MLAELTHTDFESQLGSTFNLQLNATEQLPLSLTQVQAAGQVTPVTQRRSFSLIFRSSLPGHLPQGTYRLTQAAFGDLELFLVPIGPATGGMQYQAVFG